MQDTIDGLREKIETERIARNKAELAFGEAVAELEKVKGDLLHKVDEVSVLQDIMRIKEDEIRDLKSALESVSDAHENNLKEQKLNYSHQIEEFHEKVKQQKIPISQLEKHTDQLGNERVRFPPIFSSWSFQTDRFEDISF
uniref:Myosin_tail_1 domain-containing protein n=1 Tax=Angiostrongylus cantonensis TaxID=6313 RepID=A0A0K0D7S6_ANGCA